MKRRPHRSFPGAITKTMGVLSDEGAGEAVGKSASLIRQWSDPDSAALPNISQALELDKAMLEETGSAPIFEVYTKQIEAAGLSPKAGDIIEATLGMQTACGRVSAAVQEAKSPTGPGGHRITDKERGIVLQALDSLRAQLDCIEVSVSDEPNVRVVG